MKYYCPFCSTYSDFNCRLFSDFAYLSCCGKYRIVNHPFLNSREPDFISLALKNISIYADKVKIIIFHKDKKALNIFSNNAQEMIDNLYKVYSSIEFL